MSGSTTRLKIDGKVYSGVSLDEITLGDIIVFDGQAADAGWDLTFDDVETMSDKQVEEITTREGAILTAVTVWLIKRAAGEDVTLKDAARVPATSIEELPKPGDKAPKSKGKKRSSAASALAVAPRAADTAPSETSTPRSVSA